MLEAMALGPVPVVIEYRGPAELVTPDTGYALPIGSRDDIVASLSQVLSRLADDPSHLRDIGRAAGERVFKSFTDNCINNAMIYLESIQKPLPLEA